MNQLKHFIKISNKSFNIDKITKNNLRREKRLIPDKISGNMAYALTYFKEGKPKMLYDKNISGHYPSASERVRHQGWVKAMNEHNQTNPPISPLLRWRTGRDIHYDRRGKIGDPKESTLNVNDIEDFERLHKNPRFKTLYSYSKQELKRREPELQNIRSFNQGQLLDTFPEIDNTSHNNNQLYLEPNQAPRKKIEFSAHNEKGLQYAIEENKKEHGMWMMPTVFPKATFIGKLNIDENKPSHIRYLSNILGHEEIHTALQKVGQPKNKMFVSAATKKFDNIVIPTIPSTDNTQRIELLEPYNILPYRAPLNPYSAQNIKPEIVRKLGRYKWDEDKEIIVGEERQAKTDYTSENMAIKTNIPHWLLDKLPPEHHEEAKDLLLNKQWKATQVAEKYGIESPFTGPRRPGIYLSKEEKIQLLQTKAQELGRTPRQTDLIPLIDPTPPTIRQTFGSWNKGLEAAGLTPSRLQNKNKDIKDLAIGNKLPSAIERTQQYMEENRDKRNDTTKKYYDENKENIKQKMIQWRKDNPEVMLQWKKDNPEYAKQYYEEHKKEISVQKKQYYKENKEEILARHSKLKEQNQNAGDNNEVWEDN